MNENIYKLVSEATGFQTPHASNMGDWNNINKFAELIVSECIEQIKLTMARDGHSTEHYKQSTKHIEKIKEQFGVEE